jgi:hypothetical protein
MRTLWFNPVTHTMMDYDSNREPKSIVSHKFGGLSKEHFHSLNYKEKEQLWQSLE